MTDDKKVVVNYTAKQVARLTELAPFNLALAKETGLEMGKSYRSIIAKVKNLDLEYVVKPVAKKKVATVTKPELVEQIAKTLDRSFDGLGLEKCTAKGLLVLINGIDHIKPLGVEPELPELPSPDSA